MTVNLSPLPLDLKKYSYIPVNRQISSNGVSLFISKVCSDKLTAVHGEKELKGRLGLYEITLTLNEADTKVYMRLRETAGDRKAAEIVLVNLLSMNCFPSRKDWCIIRVAAAAIMVPEIGKARELPHRSILCRRRISSATSSATIVVSIFNLAVGPVKKGRFRQVSPVIEEVLITDSASNLPLLFELREAVLIEPIDSRFPNGINDIPILRCIKEMNGGKLPEGFQDMPLVILNDAQIMKKYKLGNMAEAAAQAQLTLSGKLSAMRGPVVALQGLKDFGVCHGDTKPSNWLVTIKEKMPYGVLADFDGVMIFFKFDWENATPSERKKMAQKIIQLAYIPINHDESRPYIPSTPHTMIDKEKVRWRELFNLIWNDLCRLADGQSLDRELSDFVKNYKIFTAFFEKIQVFQTGIGVVQILFSNFKLSQDELNKVIKFTANIENHDASFEILSKKLKVLFAPNLELAEACFTFFKGTLNVSAEDRFDAAQAIAAYDTILKVEGALAPPYLT